MVLVHTCGIWCFYIDIWKQESHYNCNLQSWTWTKKTKLPPTFHLGVILSIYATFRCILFAIMYKSYTFMSDQSFTMLLSFYHSFNLFVVIVSCKEVILSCQIINIYNHTELQWEGIGSQLYRITTGWFLASKCSFSRKKNSYLYHKTVCESYI